MYVTSLVRLNDIVVPLVLISIYKYDKSIVIRFSYKKFKTKAL